MHRGGNAPQDAPRTHHVLHKYHTAKPQALPLRAPTPHVLTGGYGDGIARQHIRRCRSPASRHGRYQVAGEAECPLWLQEESISDLAIEHHHNVTYGGNVEDVI